MEIFEDNKTAGGRFVLENRGRGGEGGESGAGAQAVATWVVT